MTRWLRIACVGTTFLSLLGTIRGGSVARVTFFQVWVLAGYEGLAESAFPGMANEPTIMVVRQDEGQRLEVAAWLKELFRLESVDLLDLETVVEVNSAEVSGAQPPFFDAGESGEFRVWWLGGTSSSVEGMVVVSLAADFLGQDLVPAMQVLCAPGEMVLVARRVGLQSEGEELGSLAALGKPGMIFILAAKGELMEVDQNSCRKAVDHYLRLRGQQKPTGGTIKLVEDPGYVLMRQLFAQSLQLSDLDYGEDKRVPVSSGFPRPEVMPYDTPPQLNKGGEALMAALERVFTAEELATFVKTTVTVLVNEKGQAEEVRITPPVNQEMRRRWLRALKLLRWQPATLHGKDVHAWTVLPVGEMLK
ncbi:MAG: energy transducer TonB [candidate division KSB1 bacterium]|nr:energy transducer TonB [candidate division KSB1 bacterium]